ncbi:hypothetical protein KCP75_07370 [Salmonella enterica subsp. enterica]|nr:hypothetical protein KCP75_07370 [Salmonella enterica subsp. enterica]
MCYMRVFWRLWWFYLVVFPELLVPSACLRIVLNFASLGIIARRGRLSWCARCVYAGR